MLVAWGCQIRDLIANHRLTPALDLSVAIYTSGWEKGTVRIKCPAQEHNTMSSAGARTRTAPFGNDRTNQEAMHQAFHNKRYTPLKTS